MFDGCAKFYRSRFLQSYISSTEPYYCNFTFQHKEILGSMNLDGRTGNLTDLSTRENLEEFVSIL